MKSPPLAGLKMQVEMASRKLSLEGAVQRLKLAFPAFEKLAKTKLSTPLLVKINLISNSIKYGNGSAIELSSYFDHQSIYISVNDLGPGI